MKTLLRPKTTVSEDGKTATIVCDIADVQFSEILAQRVTVGHVNPIHMAHPRHVQISNEAIFVKAFNVGFAMPIDDIVSIASVVEPRTTFAPQFRKSTDSLTVQIASELDPDFQWEVSDDYNPRPLGHKEVRAVATWAKIDGQTTKTLDPTKVKSGQWVRCIASSEAGSMASNPVQIK
jgi:hypothetical protein